MTLNIKQKRSLWLAVPIALTVLLAVSFFILLSSINKLKSENAKLLAQNARAENELCEIEKKYSELEEQYNALKLTKSEEANCPVIYLTFDDGPSENTVKILDILAEYNIKATFFVVGKETERAKEIYRRLVLEGHTVGNHTYSHEYNEIYASTEDFWAQIQKNDDLFYSCTGKHLEIMRFPGGSNNTVSERYCKGIMQKLRAQAKEKGLVYFDWNVSATDAEVALQKTSIIIDEVLKNSDGLKKSIVLMHDNAPKTTTVEALREIIEALLERGCVFRALDQNSEPVQFLK